MNKSISGCRILIVEDEMLVMMQATDLLADLGCVTVAAPTVEKALALIAEEPFDAAMLDMNLGGRMAFPVADALIAHGVPFLYVSGYADEENGSGYRDRPMLRKPFRPHHLTDALVNLIVPTPII